MWVIITIDKVVSAQPIRMDAPLGVNRPYNCTAVGKVLLAGLPDEELERLAADGAFEQRTERSVSEAEALRAEIERIRVQGWARDDEEYISGAGCVAAPVRDHEGQVIAALTVSGPAERVREKFDHLVAQVKACAAAISEEMGCRNPQI
jgi:DNA-binding IclR family transcriptional regulator